MSDSELLEEVTRRYAERKSCEGMSMTEIELSVEAMVRGHGEPSVRAMLSRMKAEKPTAKACPTCGNRTQEKARDRERTVRNLSGP